MSKKIKKISKKLDALTFEIDDINEFLVEIYSKVVLLKERVYELEDKSNK